MGSRADHRERLVDGPVAEVEEAPEELEGSQAMLLREEHLQHNGQLLRRLTVLGAKGEPDFKGRELGMCEGRVEE